MARRALGMVETQGFVPAVEAADAMCKAARVEIERLEVTRDALVTVLVRGDLAEVEAAVAAGAARAARLGAVLRGHVIPAPDAELEGVVIAHPEPASRARRASPTLPEHRRT